MGLKVELSLREIRSLLGVLDALLECNHADLNALAKKYRLDEIRTKLEQIKFDTADAD